MVPIESASASANGGGVAQGWLGAMAEMEDTLRGVAPTVQRLWSTIEADSGALHQLARSVQAMAGQMQALQLEVVRLRTETRNTTQTVTAQAAHIKQLQIALKLSSNKS